MNKYLSLLSVILITLPAQAQIKPLKGLKAASASSAATQRLTRQVAAATRNAKIFHVGLSNSSAKHILNKRLQFQKEYRRAADLYKQLQSSFNPKKMERQIKQTIINRTLKTTLLNELADNSIASMAQELDNYFNLSNQLPIFSFSPSPDEAFALAARGYLLNHPQKPSWQLREVIKFGEMHALQQQVALWAANKSPKELAKAHNLTEKETKQLLSLYERAEKLQVKIKEFIAKKTHTKQENDEILQTFRDMNNLYEELLAFARNTYSVKTTIKIYTDLLKDMEKFVAEHHRAPVWQNPEERPLSNRFATLVFNNQINQFEEIIPVMNKLYALTEMYPVQRLPETTALREIKSFYKANGFLPRATRNRDFFDIRSDEPFLLENMKYWEDKSPAFRQEIEEILFPKSDDNYPPFF